jgi:hypothetical protein
MKGRNDHGWERNRVRTARAAHGGRREATGWCDKAIVAAEELEIPPRSGRSRGEERHDAVETLDRAVTAE